MCPFDHGSDPVVVEDVNLPNMLSFQPPQIPGVEPPPPPGLPPPPPLMSAPPVNLRPPVPPPCALPPSLPPVAGRNSNIFLGIWFCVLEWLMIKGKGKKMTPSCLLLLLMLLKKFVTYKMFFFSLFNTGPPPPLPPLQPSGMDAPPSSITSSVPTIVTSGIRSSIPQASVPMFNSGWCLQIHCFIRKFTIDLLG